MSNIDSAEDALAKTLFQAYNSQGPNPGKTHDGKDVPPWEELGEQVQTKWKAAAREAINRLGWGKLLEGEQA